MILLTLLLTISTTFGVTLSKTQADKGLYKRRSIEIPTRL